MQQEVVLAMLAKEPSHGYELRARLRQALGPLGDGMNDGQVYVTLTRLEKAGLVACEQTAGLPDRPDRKMYGLTAAGQQRVAEWLAETGWPKPDLTGFHLKLIAAAAAGLADPLAIVDAQRRELLGRLRAAQRSSATAEVKGSILLDRIADAENINLPEEEVENELQAISLQMREPVETLRARLTEDGSLARIRERLRREKMGALLYERLAV